MGVGQVGAVAQIRQGIHGEEHIVHIVKIIDGLDDGGKIRSGGGLLGFVQPQLQFFHVRADVDHIGIGGQARALQLIALGQQIAAGEQTQAENNRDQSKKLFHGKPSFWDILP